MNSHTKCKGFTLIELVIAITLTLILVSVASAILVQQFRLFNIGQELLNADWQVRISFERMAKDLRNTDTINVANIGELSFQDEQDNTITYQLVNNQLMLSSTAGSGSQSALADNINNFELHYYDANVAELTPPLTGSSLSDIRYITITLNVVDRHTDFEITTGEFLWNVK